ncbi:MAG TPA: acyltransferase [Actinomycetota bacterium]|nr:acyltransferase [Actinomycetota bacterium]
MGVLRRFLGRASVALYRFAGRASTKVFSVAVGGSFAHFGRRSVVQPPVRLNGERFIEIGDNVFIGRGSWLQVLGNDHDRPVITVGDGTSIVGHCVLSATHSVTLGRSVLFARNVYVADHQHAFGDLDAAVLEQGVTRVGPVEIAEGAWLGQNVVVGPGVRIGRGAVIGANSVVLSDVPDHAVAVGAPARVVRTADDAHA